MRAFPRLALGLLRAREMNAREMNLKNAVLLSMPLLALVACSGSVIDVADDSGADAHASGDAGFTDSAAHHADAESTPDGAIDARAGDDAGPTIGIDGSTDDASVAYAGAPDASSRAACLAACEAAHPEGASDGQLMLGDCCGGTCATSCTSGPCFSGSTSTCKSC